MMYGSTVIHPLSFLTQQSPSIKLIIMRAGYSFLRGSIILFALVKNYIKNLHLGILAAGDLGANTEREL